VWATLLAAEQRDLRKFGLPPVSVEFPNGSPQQGRAGTRGSKPKATNWHKLLNDAMDRSIYEPRYVEQEHKVLPRLAYVLDLQRSSVLQEAVLAIRYDGANDGSAKSLKRATITSSEVAHLSDELDRTICAMLIGAADPARVSSYNDLSRRSSANSFWKLESNLYSAVLPLLARSGRFFFAFDDETAHEPLVADESSPSSPWRLGVRICQNLPPQGAKTPVPPEHILKVGFSRGGKWIDAGSGAVYLATRPALLIDSGVLRCVQDGGARYLFEALRSSVPPKIGREEFAVLLKEIGERGLKIDIDWDDSFGVARRTDVKPQGIVLLRPPPGGKASLDSGLITAEVQFAYDTAIVGHAEYRGHITPPAPDGQVNEVIRRDFEAEAALIANLVSLGIRPAEGPGAGMAPALVSRDELIAAVAVLVRDGWKVLGGEFVQRRPGNFSIKVTSGIDWFSLKGNVEFGSETVDVASLLAMLKRGERTVVLGDGTTGVLPEDWIEKNCPWLRLGEAVKDDQGADEVRFAASQLGVIDALLTQMPEASFDANVAAARKRLDGFRGIKPLKEPAAFRGTLRDYQRDGLGWLGFLRDFAFGGILADDMGLGKTVQLLAHIQQCRSEKKRSTKPWLIVAPKSLVFNWAREAARFTPKLRTIEYTGPARSQLLDEIPACDLVLTTYANMRSDAPELHAIKWEYVVLDEAQAIKNAESLVAKAARIVGAAAERRLAMTGTPIENSLEDLWSIMEFLNPGMLGSATAFREVSKLQRTTQDGSDVGLIRRAVRPFILRRTKDVVAKELPSRIEQTITCELGAGQKKLYQSVLKHYRETLLGKGGKVESDGLSRSRIHVLEALLRLRQVACHPSLFEAKPIATAKERGNRAGKDAAESASGKIEAMLELLDEILAERHKILIFSQFTSLLAIVLDAIKRRKVSHEYLDGQTSAKDRAAAVDRFQSDSPNSPRVFVVSLKAGGVGLNLTAADYVFLLDPWWNPAVEAQAIDRAHRIGQTRKVVAYRFISSGTVEERIQELQATKRELANSIMSEDGTASGGPLASLTRDELDWLLS
jgi:superfamily II DNA or RNA helicase